MLWKCELVAYNPNWPGLDQSAVRSLQLQLPMMLAFEHVGSTALPGMTAVATIDILAGVRELTEIDDQVVASLAAGWEHPPDVEARIPNRRFFNNPPVPSIELLAPISSMSSSLIHRRGATR